MVGVTHCEVVGASVRMMTHHCACDRTIDASDEVGGWRVSSDGVLSYALWFFWCACRCDRDMMIFVFLVLTHMHLLVGACLWRNLTQSGETTPEVGQTTHTHVVV